MTPTDELPPYTPQILPTYSPTHQVLAATYGLRRNSRTKLSYVPFGSSSARSDSVVSSSRGEAGVQRLVSNGSAGSGSRQQASRKAVYHVTSRDFTFLSKRADLVVRREWASMEAAGRSAIEDRGLDSKAAVDGQIAEATFQRAGELPWRPRARVSFRGANGGTDDGIKLEQLDDGNWYFSAAGRGFVWSLEKAPWRVVLSERVRVVIRRRARRQGHGSDVQSGAMSQTEDRDSGGQSHGEELSDQVADADLVEEARESTRDIREAQFEYSKEGMHAKNGGLVGILKVWREEADDGDGSREVDAEDHQAVRDLERIISTLTVVLTNFRSEGKTLVNSDFGG